MRKYLKEFLLDARILFLSGMFIIYVVAVSLTAYNSNMWFMVLAGIVAFFLLEYVIHRYLLHGYLSKLMPKAHEGHEDHHNHPDELKHMLTPNVYTIPSHLFLWVVTTILLRSLHLSSCFMIGIALYQFYYEWTHFVSHRPIVPMTPWGKWMKKYHLLHHYKNSRHWYGVTNPVFDTLMGTNVSPKSVETDKTNYIHKG
ncbi:fatty acid hydroxylase [Paenibacillus albiflavus]|uniref:Fatty acid hydroxylase n=1 Tax=Paenibacillus albiflavus TaxID=2545760 RepID=A0A4R4E5U5_9BACL|nr:sterol desaturase family protein [Paenibacillus albiflavus]TCZ73411.1 fatty acid hydroxylase [Paenibacillus albiflavus]